MMQRCTWCLPGTLREFIHLPPTVRPRGHEQDVELSQTANTIKKLHRNTPGENAL